MADGVSAPKATADSSHGSGRGLSATCLALGVWLAGCQAAPVAPVSPGRLADTPVAGGAGTVATATFTPGPAPSATPAATRVVPPPQALTVPPDFGVGVFAEGLGPARFMALSPSGDLFVTVPAENQVLVLPDRIVDGVADEARVYAEGDGLNQPHGIAFRPGWLYVANTDGVVRFAYEPGDLVAGGPPEMAVPLPGGGQHWTRTLAFGPDNQMFVSIGADCNVCQETDARRASVLSFAADAPGGALFAAGLRNAVGLAFHPRTGELWATDNGRDLMGDDLPPDELNRLVGGSHYGWPHCFGQAVFDPELGGDPAFCRRTVPAAVEFPAHVAPLGLAFYTGSRFPPEYRDGAFVAWHGSWNRSLPVGYSVAFVPFVDGAPTGDVRDFATGWLRPDTDRWGRPVDVAVAPDGSLLVSDDAGGRIYRFFYVGPEPTPTPGFGSRG